MNLQISNLHYKDDSKCLISQNEKENQKTDIVNVIVHYLYVNNYIVVLCIHIIYIMYSKMS